MKKKNTARDNVNLFFSAFLIIAYIICGYFFASFASAIAGELGKNLVTAAIFAVFGLLVFYATRVGEGKTVKRFSIVTLIVLDIPALYIILAFAISAFPFHTELASAPVVAYLAAVALGYAVPYTFISGFENIEDDAKAAQAPAKKDVLEGGLEEELREVAEPSEPTYTPDVEEIVVEGSELVGDIEPDEE